MRTTLTLDSDIARKLKELASREKKSFKEIVNETLKAGLSAVVTEATPFRVKTHRCGFRRGVDPVKLNQLYDDLETKDAVAEKRRSYS